MRFHLYPTIGQSKNLSRHCSDARFVWNLALEQWNCWQSGSNRHTPGFGEQCHQLTELREEFPWIAEGSAVVQQQALRDFDQAKRYFYNGTHGRPNWRRKGIDEGFRIVGQKTHTWDIHSLNRHWAQVKIPKIGWVRFRSSRPLPDDIKSFRVTLQIDQWHISFPAIPKSINGPSDQSLIGIDRGVAVPFFCSDGSSYSLPTENSAKLRRLQRHLARQKKCSGRRNRTKLRIAKLQAKNTRCRKDVIEKATTDLARRCDYFCIEDLRIKNMTRSAKGTLVGPGRKVKQKSGLNRAILQSGWGLFARRLEDKAPYRVERVNPKYTSQTCSNCGHIASESRKSQAVFKCVKCNFTMNADFNAAINIAAGHAVTARGGWIEEDPPMNREPQF